MKSIYVAFIGMLLSITVSSQTLPPYQRYKTVPGVKLILPKDSTGWELKAHLAKDKPLLVILFSPECDHCKHETEELVKNIDKFKNVQIVMAAMPVFPLWVIDDFITHYGLNKYSNITVGKDYAYILPTYYDIRNLPFHAFYNKNKNLIAGFEGSMSIDKIIQTLSF